MGYPTDGTGGTHSMITALALLLAIVGGLALFGVAAVLLGADSRDRLADDHTR